jgi:NADH oxidase (H2O2-forming)
MSENTNRKIVIIGLGSGGLYVAKSAMSTSKNVEVTIIEKRSYDMFSPCSLPFAIEGVVDDFEKLKFSVPGHLKRMKKLTSHEALKIDPKAKTVTVKNLETEKTFEINYDSLVLALGSKPIILPIPGANELLGNGVFVVSTIENSIELKEHAKNSKSAVLVGGGGIGLEIAVALKNLGLDLVITKRTPPVLPKTLDPDMGQIIEDHLNELGFRILFGKGIDRINGNDWVESVEIAGETIPTDLVVMAVGVEPNVELAKNAGIELSNKGIKVSERLETSIPDIYAIGDCIDSYNLINKEHFPSHLATSAYLQGIIAGANATGAEEIYEGTLGTFVSKIGKLEIAATGFNTEMAKSNGYDVVTSRIKHWIKPEYMPGSTELSVKLIADKETGKLLGGQAVGEQGAAWRINIIALAIREGIAVTDLGKTELAYSPPVSEMYDVLSMAIEFAARKVKRTSEKVLK